MRSEAEIQKLRDMVAHRYQKLIAKYESLKQEAAIAWVKDSPDLDKLDKQTLIIARAIRESEILLDVIGWFEEKKPRYYPNEKSYLDEYMLSIISKIDLTVPSE